MIDERAQKELQKIIKAGCASHTPYPWCKVNECTPDKACWWHEAGQILEAGYRKGEPPLLNIKEVIMKAVLCPVCGGDGSEREHTDVKKVSQIKYG